MKCPLCHSPLQVLYSRHHCLLGLAVTCETLFYLRAFIQSVSSIPVSLLPALHPATRVIFKTNQIWSFPSSINKRAISYNQHSLAGSPPTCLSPPHNVHFSPSLSLPTPTSTRSLALCCGFCFFFLGCANAHPHARVFAHALTPVLTVLPP